MRIFFTLHIILTCLYGVCAQDPPAFWQETNAPWGGSVKLTQLNNGTLYAQSNTVTRYIYRSNDAGQHWTELEHISHDPALSFNYFVIGHAGTFYHKTSIWNKSTDEGATWTPLSANTSNFFRLLETPSGTIIALGNNNLYRSVDGGQTWTATFTGGANLSSSSLYLERLPDGSIILKAYGTSNIIIRSTDDGQTWNQRGYNEAYELQFITPDGAYILYNTSGAVNLVNQLVRQSGPGMPLVEVGSFLPLTGYHILNTGRILISVDNELYFSDDDGFTWAPFIPSTSIAVNSLIPHIQLPDGTFFCIGMDALHKSSDAGQTWSFSAVGIRKPQVKLIRFQTDSTYFASTTSGIWKTENAGHDWSAVISYGLSNWSGEFALTPTGGIISLHDRKLLYSAQGNAPFTDISPAAPGNFGNNKKLFYNPQSGAIFVFQIQSGVSGLARSVDYGQSWQYIPLSTTIDAMVFHPSGVILATDGEQIYTSLDGGLQWAASLPSGIDFIENIFVSPDGSLYIKDFAIGAPNLWKSTDAGNTWNLASVMPSTSINSPMVFAENGHIYYNNGDWVYGSFNQGATWQNLPQFDSGIPQQFFFGETQLYITPSQKLYLQHGELFHLLSQQSISTGAFVEGEIKVDADADCSTDDSQDGRKNWIVAAHGTNFSFYTNTDEQGRYLFFLDTGSYQIQSITPNSLWWDFCEDSQAVTLEQYFERDTANFTALALVDCPLLSVELGTVGLRRCFENNIRVTYCNLGTQTAYDAWVDIELDPFMSFVSSTQPHSDPVNNIVRFFVGDIISGDCGQFQLTVYINCDSTILGQTHCVTAHGFPDTLCFPVNNWSGADIRASVACQDSIVLFKLQNVGDAPSQILDYIIIEDDVVMFQNNQDYAPDQLLEIPVTANGHTFRIESEQEPGHPFSNVAIAFQEGCGGYESLGFINQFSVNDRNPSWHRLCEPNTGSYDPNDKHGYPIGVGEDHRILPGQPIEYRIRYQNTGTDTAFTVVIRDTLDASLDPFSIVMGASSHTYNWQLEGPGILKFTFNNIHLPDSNVNWEGSQGFIRFRISQKPNLPLGTQIRNRAGIYFDFNDPVITNETMHTIGFPDVVSSTNQPIQKQTLVKILPNPAKEKAVFELPEEHLKGHRLVIFSPSSHPVCNLKINEKQTTVPRNNLPSGVYGWALHDPHGNLIESGVLIFE